MTLYAPSGAVSDPAVAEELLQISRAIRDIESRIYPKLNVAPAKPRDGLIAFADGTNWDPGSGEGLYRYDESDAAWVYLETPVYDYWLEVAKGNVTGSSLIHKFGANEGIPNGGTEIVTSLSASGLGIFLAATSTVRIKSGGDAADTAAGAGAREVTVQGIDDSLNEVSETIATAGASASSATTTSFWRVHRAWVSDAGTNNGSNTGAIVIETSGGTQDLLQIDAGYGQSLHAVYTSPTGYDMYLLSVHLTADSSQVVNFSLFKRENISDVTPGVEAHRMQNYWDGVQQDFIYKPHSPIKISTVPCDLWIEAYGDGNPASVSANMEILLVANT